jgi:hypothetical protein
MDFPVLPSSQSTGLKRGESGSIKDKYYTKSSIVSLCLQKYQQIVPISENDLIIEPSAGSGVFYDEIVKFPSHTIAYDLYPEKNPNILVQDYLTLTPPNRVGLNKIHVIGNPPFGRQSSLAKKFIKKSVEFCDFIGFILPKSFKKKSFQSTFPLKFHLLETIDLPENSFEVDNESYDVPCVFQIWEKREENREQNKKVLPKGYQFVKKSEHPDLSFRRVGIYAGTISIEIENKSEQSHYFLKLDDSVDQDVFLDRYKNEIRFETDNTVGPRSISKNELIPKLNLISE